MPYLILIISLIQPFYALFFAMFETIKKKSSLLVNFCIALSFATITFALEPPSNFDLYRHYERILSLQGLSLNHVITTSKDGYYLFDIYAWIINSLNLPIEIFPASLVLVGYCLVLSVFNDVKLKYLLECNKLYIGLSFVIFWLSIGFVALSSGIRSPFAAILIFYFAYKLIFYNRIILFVLGSIFAFFIHPFSLALSLIVLSSYIFKSFSKNGRFLVVIGIFISLTSELIKVFINYIVSILGSYGFFRVVYFDDKGEFGNEFLTSKSIGGVIATIIIPRLPVYFSYVYLLIFKPKESDALYLSLCIITIFFGIFQSFYIIYGRMTDFFIYMFSLFIVVNLRNRNSVINNLLLIIYALILMIYAAGNTYAYSYYLNDIASFILRPLFFIFFKI